MTHDPYSNCPCGSGKKLKFCCADILPDLLRVHRLEENQPEAAEKILRDLNSRFPNREVVVAELCRLLGQMGQPEEARELLASFLKQYPDHPRGLVWMARSALSAEGFSASRRLLHRALQISSKAFPREMAEMVNAVGLHLAANEEFMGGREHIALAARLAGPEEGRQYLMNLAMLEADGAIPFVLRTPHSLLPVTGTEETMQQDLRARKLSLIGCWEPAAILYSRLSDSDPQNGSVWYNLGLCKAWDGRSMEAAPALHRAAELLTDFDTAAEAEALAQVLDQSLPERCYKVLRYVIPVKSASELLTRLDEMDNIRRYDDAELDSETRQSRLPAGLDRVALLDIMDKPIPDLPVSSASQLSESIAELELLDIVDEQEAQQAGFRHPLVWLTVSDDIAEQTLTKLRDDCGDLLLPVPDDAREPEVLATQPLDSQEFDRQMIRPDGLSGREFRRLTGILNESLVEHWMKRPLLSLDGKSAVEAAADPAFKTRLAAAVLVLGVNARYYDRPIDLAALRSRLQVPEPSETILSEGQHCAAFPAFFVQRLNCTKLDDQQLQEYCNRVSMVGFPELAKKGLDELLTREAALQQFGVVRACLMRSAIARTDDDREKMSACLQKARDVASTARESFRELLEIEIRELAMRLDDPTDPELVVLLHRIRDRYLPKLPEIGEVIQMQLLASGCEHLVGELEAPLSVGSSASGLWTPESSREQSGEGNRLWLPGQD